MDKVLNQILSELKELKNGQGTIVARLENVESGQARLEASQEELLHAQVRLENKFDDKIEALFDDRDVQNGAISILDETVKRIEAKVDVLQMETAQLRRIK